MTDQELLDNSPQIYCGGEFREKTLNNIFYGNMHGEDIVTKSNTDWAKDFIYRFATYQVPCHFLNTHKRLAIKGKGSNKHCEFSDGIVSYAKGRIITQNGKIIKDGDTLFMPVVQKDSTYIAYSKNGDCRDWDITESDKATAEVYKITENGNEFLYSADITDGKISLKIKADTAYIVLLK